MKRFVIVALALMALMSCAESGQKKIVSFDDVISMRRSIRDFDASKSVSKAEVRAVIAAAQEAPSWTNSQPSRYYVAMSPGKVQAVREVIGDRNKRNTEGASALIVSTFVRGLSGFRRGGEPANEVGEGWGAYDNGLSDAHLVLAARAMGFDTLIMGARDADALRSIFDIPEEETIMAVIALGYRASDPERPFRKPLDEILKFF
ncbi:MAG: nitroreductase family protein [Bacteroidales bacterium]|nr:nitroreductase family protein [Bacteroidales bacterium]